MPFTVESVEKHTKTNASASKPQHKSHGSENDEIKLLGDDKDLLQHPHNEEESSCETTTGDNNNSNSNINSSSNSNSNSNSDSVVGDAEDNSSQNGSSSCPVDAAPIIIPESNIIPRQQLSRNNPSARVLSLTRRKSFRGQGHNSNKDNNKEAAAAAAADITPEEGGNGGGGQERDGSSAEEQRPNQEAALPTRPRRRITSIIMNIIGKVLFNRWTKWFTRVLNVMLEASQVTLTEVNGHQMISDFLCYELICIISSVCLLISVNEFIMEAKRSKAVFQTRGKCCCWLYNPGTNGRLFGSLPLYFSLITSATQFCLNLAILLSKKRFFKADYAPLLLALVAFISSLIHHPQHDTSVISIHES